MYELPQLNIIYIPLSICISIFILTFTFKIGICTESKGVGSSEEVKVKRLNAGAKALPHCRRRRAKISSYSVYLL